MIKAVIWDMGGILVNVDGLISRKAWERRLGLSSGKLDRIVFEHPLAPQIMVGQISLDEMWAAIGNDLHLSDREVAKLRQDFWEGAEWDQELFEYLRILKEQYKLGMLSNAWADTRDDVKEWVNEDLFDVIMFSAEEGMCKPAPGFYQVMLSRLGVEAEEAIFVDDTLQNVRGAEALGISGIHYTEELDIREAIDYIVTREEY